MYPICFRFVRYRMLDGLNSRTLLDERCGYICDNRFSGIEDVQFRWGVSASYGKGKLRMQNFCGMYLQVIERASWGCRISMRSILMLSKMWNVDAIVYNRQAEKYLQVQRKASCRYVGPKKSICNSEYQSLADTSVYKRASAMSNKLRI